MIKPSFGEPTVSAAPILDLFDGLVELGVLAGPQVEAAGIRRSDLENIEARFPVSLVQALWRLGEQSPVAQNLGLYIGSRVNLEALGMISNVIRFADTLREVIVISARYAPVMSEVESIRIGGISPEEWHFEGGRAECPARLQ